MFKRSRLAVVTSLISASLLGLALRASAQDVLTAAKTVEVESDVKGDVAAAGESITIAGSVEGYVLGAGRTVRVDAPVGNDLWAAAETVDIRNTIGNNAMVAGRRVRLKSGAVVNGDLHVFADRVTVAPGAIVRGELTVRSPRPPEVSPRAQVAHVRYQQMDDRWVARPWPLAWFLTFLALLILGSAITAFVPERTRRVAATLHARFARSLLVGVLTVALTPIGIVALAVTVVGLPLAAVLSAIYVLLLALSAGFVSYRIGEWLLDLAHGTTASQWARMALGALVVSLGVTVPFLGWAVAGLVVISGAGALALEERDLRSQLHGTGLA